MYTRRPINNGFFLPNLSNKGPYNNCPAEMPMKKLDKDRDTLAVLVRRSAAMAGNPGRYMSIEKGPRAVSEPSIKIRPKYFF